MKFCMRRYECLTNQSHCIISFNFVSASLGENGMGVYRAWPGPGGASPQQAFERNPPLFIGALALRASTVFLYSNPFINYYI